MPVLANQGAPAGGPHDAQVTRDEMLAGLLVLIEGAQDDATTALLAFRTAHRARDRKRALLAAEAAEQAGRRLSVLTRSLRVTAADAAISGGTR